MKKAKAKTKAKCACAWCEIAMAQCEIVRAMGSQLGDTVTGARLADTVIMPWVLKTQRAKEELECHSNAQKQA